MRDRLNKIELGRRISNAARNLRNALGKVRHRSGESVIANPLPKIDEADFRTKQEHEEQVGRVRAEIRKSLESQGK